MLLAVLIALIAALLTAPVASAAALNTVNGSLTKNNLPLTNVTISATGLATGQGTGEFSVVDEGVAFAVSVRCVNVATVDGGLAATISGVIFAGPGTGLANNATRLKIFDGGTPNLDNLRPDAYTVQTLLPSAQADVCPTPTAVNDLATGNVVVVIAGS